MRRARELARRALGRPADPVTPALPEALTELARRGPTVLGPTFGGATDAALSVAVVMPSFRQGSGGHATIVHLASALAARGHAVSLWLEDFEQRHARDGSALTGRQFVDWFGGAELELHCDFSAWQGADVAVATGWQTVPRVLLLPGVSGRAYLVQDHEPEFYPTSAQSLFAAETYRQGLHCVAASPWLAQLLRDRYGASSSSFDLAVDHAVYSPRDESRRDDTVAFYARAATPRRAVPLGLLALGELTRRRPGVRIALFGGDAHADFHHEALGTVRSADLATLYRQATVGMVFSLTNPSLVGLEMMACGLPCVELDSEPMRASFGVAGPLRLTPPEPLTLCSTIEALLDDEAERRRLGDAGLAFVQGRTWSRAAEQVEAGLRHALVPR